MDEFFGFVTEAGLDKLRAAKRAENKPDTVIYDAGTYMALDFTSGSEDGIMAMDRITAILISRRAITPPLITGHTVCECTLAFKLEGSNLYSIVEETLGMASLPKEEPPKKKLGGLSLVVNNT
jgi:hypothetical protein